MYQYSRFTIHISLPMIFMLLFLLACGGAKKVVQTDVPNDPIVSLPKEVVEEEPEEDMRPVVEKPSVPLVLNRIHFDFDKYNIRPDAMPVLQENASVMRAHTEVRVTIEGHCDERGTLEYNLLLGERRAKAAREYLITLGVSPDRISTISYGKERPLDSRRNESAYAMNRRSDFIIKKEVASN